MKVPVKPMILHMDMDAFYASVEQADCPELKGKCIVIGGRSGRSVVSAASYEARRFGVRSAMPMFQALEKCPEAIVLPVRMERYKTISDRIMKLLDSFSPLVEPVSIDEAFLDFSDCRLMDEEIETIARKIKSSIRDEFGLSCSIGIAPLKFLAKIASDLNKPDGLTIIRPEEVLGFIKKLPVEKVPGVGKRTAEILQKMGIRLLGDVNRRPEASVIRRLGKFGTRLIDLSRGIDPSTVAIQREVKSIGSEETFAEDTRDRAFIKKSIFGHAEEVARMLRKNKARAKTISIKIKHSDFKTVTRSTTLQQPGQTTEYVYKAAVNLFDAYPIKKSIRLVGVTASSLVSEDLPAQMPLFTEENTPENWEKVEKVLDAINARYGEAVIQKARLIQSAGDDGIRKKR